MKSRSSTSLVWLRRDLRLSDNISIYSALEKSEKIQPFFIFDKFILERFSNKEDQRLSFIADSLCKIDSQIRENGGKGLLIFHGEPKNIVPKIAALMGANSVFAGKDFETYGMKRDGEVFETLKYSNRELILQNDHLILQPMEVLKSDKTPYKIFTPYSKAWIASLKESHIKFYDGNDKGRYCAEEIDFMQQEGLLDISKGSEFLLSQVGYKYSPNNFFPASGAVQVLKNFTQNKIDKYSENRNLVYLEGTSKLSPYLRFGLISIRQCYNLAMESNNWESWVNELIWRDFYAAILYHFPKTPNQEFLPQYRKLEWSYNAEHLQRWQQGLTGYPIIDAAMRQLNQEGWMHNRARMIVASFFSKDLLLDWRLGEEYFAQKLMDYDLSSNVGGWQWAASVGTDAQPYFRIFNPLSQSEKFDPAGIYIKKYIPELADIPVKFIHEPHKYIGKINYPSQIVKHDEARKEALLFFKNCC